MSDTIDQITDTTVREIAEQLIRDAAADIEYLTISEQLDDYGLSPEEAEKAAKRIAWLVDRAEITVTFPEESGS